MSARSLWRAKGALVSLTAHAEPHTSAVCLRGELGRVGKTAQPYLRPAASARTPPSDGPTSAPKRPTVCSAHERM